ncbi:MAG: metal ABC transporter permease [Bacillota bacterium]
MELYIPLTIIAIGALVAGSAGLVGSFLILRRMAMLGDAISHAVLPGIAVAFLLTGSREPLIMVLGAGAFGLVTAWLVQTLQRAGVQEDAGIGVTFTALFAVGVVLIALFAGRVHLDLEHVLYGEIAYAPWDQWVLAGWNLGPRALWTMGLIFLVDLTVIALFYKELKICAFDPSTAAALGINVGFFHYLLMSLVSITTVGAFDSVGAILVVAMLVVPGATAYLLTEKLSVMLGLAVGVGALSSLFGYLLARWTDSSIAAAMSAVAGFLFLLAFLFAPGTGLVARLLHRRRLAGPGGQTES